MFNCKPGINRFIVVHLVKKNYIVGVPANVIDVTRCNNGGPISFWCFCKTRKFWRSWLNTDIGKKKISFVSSPHVVFWTFFYDSCWCGFNKRFYYSKNRKRTNIWWCRRQKLITINGKTKKWFVLNKIFLYNKMLVILDCCEIVFK